MFLLVIIGGVYICPSARGQGSVVELKSNGCEIDEANFNAVRVSALPTVNEGGSLIVIARLGANDKRRSLNRKRLNATKQWLAKTQFPITQLVLAEGQRTRGAARVEFYIGGKLTHIIAPRRNMGLCTECCNPRPADFYRARKRRTS